MVEIETKTESRPSAWMIDGETEVNRRRVHWRISTSPLAWRPPTDVYITGDAITVRVEIAGMRDGEFIISLDEHILTIRGTRPDLPERRAYHQMEIRFGEFRTDVELHWPIDPDGIEAEYRDGFLRLTLPRAKPHSIEIQD